MSRAVFLDRAGVLHRAVTGESAGCAIFLIDIIDIERQHCAPDGVASDLASAADRIACWGRAPSRKEVPA